MPYSAENLHIPENHPTGGDWGGMELSVGKIDKTMLKISLEHEITLLKDTSHAPIAENLHIW